MNCELCGAEVNVVGNTTKHYEPVHNLVKLRMEIEALKKVADRYQGQKKQLRIELAKQAEINNGLNAVVHDFEVKLAKQAEQLKKVEAELKLYRLRDMDDTIINIVMPAVIDALKEAVKGKE